MYSLEISASAATEILKCWWATAILNFPYRSAVPHRGDIASDGAYITWEEIIANFIKKEVEIDVITFLNEFMFDEIKITVLLTKFSDKPKKVKILLKKIIWEKKIAESKHYLDDLAVSKIENFIN